MQDQFADPMKVPKIQLPSSDAMDRMTLLPFSTSDLLMRYPLGFPPPTSNQTPYSDMKIHLPSSLATDPRLWSREDVAYFLRWCETEFDLPHFDMDLFQMNGKALCFLTKSDLNERCSGSGGVLHNVLQMLIREANNLQRCLPSSPVTPTSRHPRYPFSALQYTGWSLPELYAHNAAHMMQSGGNSVTLSPVPSTDSQSRSPEHSADNQASSGFGSGGSTGSHQSDSEEDFTVNSPSAAPPPSSPPPASPSPVPRIQNAHQKSPNVKKEHFYRPQQQQQPQQPQQQQPSKSSAPPAQHFFPPNDIQPEHNTNGRLLWDFLQQLLNDPAQRYTNFIAWKNHETGVFKIVDPAGLAKLWGIQKNHLSMNYDKMSRALRYYYRVNILRKVQGERHCYQFLRNPGELKQIKNISLLRQQINLQQQQQQQNPPSQQPVAVKTEPVQPEDQGVDIKPTDLSRKEQFDRNLQECINLQRIRQFQNGNMKVEETASDEPTDLTSPKPVHDTMRLSIVKTEV